MALQMLSGHGMKNAVMIIVVKQLRFCGPERAGKRTKLGTHITAGEFFFISLVL